MNLIRTVLNGLRVMMGTALGYEKRLDEYTSAHRELIQFINDNTILLDNNKRPPYSGDANREEITAKYNHLMKLRDRVESKLKIAK
jgi:hypothetical protein